MASPCRLGPRLRHTLCIVALAAPVSGQPLRVLGYDALLIPPLPGQSSVYLTALDDFGRVLAESSRAPSNPYLWDNGTQSPLTPPSGYLFPRVGGLSPTSRAIAGWGLGGLYTDGIVWRAPGGATVLTTPAFALASLAADVNDAGWVVGETDFPDAAILWRGAEIINLGTLPGGRSIAAAYAVNAVGEVVGVADNGAELRPFLWQDGVMIDVGGLPADDPGWATAVNDLAEVVGYLDRDGFVWSGGEVRRLPALDTCNGLTKAFGINNDGVIVGRSSRRGDCFEGHAAVWSVDAQGRYQVRDIVEDLPLRNYPPTLTLFEAVDINVAGQVAANGEDDVTGVAAGVLLSPYHFLLSEPDPGRAGVVNTVTVTGLQPREKVAMVWGIGEGASPAGTVCPGGIVLMKEIRGVVGPIPANGAGEAEFVVTVPVQAGGLTVRLQALAPQRCAVSHVVETTLLR